MWQGKIMISGETDVELSIRLIRLTTRPCFPLHTTQYNSIVLRI